ncbi:hypothetical protein GDO78_022065 [Eleutherodactylus coqui]|uniref:Uncharacterized protein n=1 Tax=Eleutherodactylus coqui TaxID=57060 RepID=A0A8J6B9U0_ELECQ|nr:hypothetical protein GDO78_022065 [Eleutherodactylus coqui]
MTRPQHIGCLGHRGWRRHRAERWSVLKLAFQQDFFLVPLPYLGGSGRPDRLLHTEQQGGCSLIQCRPMADILCFPFIHSLGLRDVGWIF